MTMLGTCVIILAAESTRNEGQVRRDNWRTLEALLSKTVAIGV